MTTASQRSGLVGNAGAVALGTGVANVLAYGLTVAGARLLGPGEFGAFTALLALVIVGNVAALAVQATTARAVVANGAAVRGAVRSGLVLAGVVTAGFLALAPATVAVMNLPTVGGAVAAAVAIGAVTAAAPALGYAQGAERFRLLAAMVAAQTGLRVCGGVVGIVVGGTSQAALIGIAAGFVVAAVLCWALARPAVGGAGGRHLVSGLRATVVSGSMLLGFVILTNVDVVLARHVLTDHDSGLYAAGAIITKVAFWLPQFVPLLAFPALADPARRRGAVNAGVAAVAGFGVVLVAGCWLFSDLAVDVIAGDAYADLAPWVPAFGALGALYALAHLLVYAQLARGDRWTIAVVWTVLVTYVAWVEAAAHDLRGVVLPGIVAAALLVCWGLVREGALRAALGRCG